MKTKYVQCAICDISCQLKATIDTDGKVNLMADMDHPMSPGSFCIKARKALDLVEHPDRLQQPLKRVGARGENRWESIGWAQAMDEIAARLRQLVNKHGPETLAVSNQPSNTAVDGGMTRRFMNLLGSPNWTSGLAYCVGNTAAINRMTYGWFPFPDIETTGCIVLLGHDPGPHSWVSEYIRIRRAQQLGAKLIVLDPRKSKSAERADIHLPLKVGTDTAMLMGWVHIIIEEGLYDKKFVEQWTFGFEQLRERVSEFTPEHTASITGVDPVLIKEAARTYANAKGAVIPWSPITDQQVSSTSAIRLQAILRSITGNVGVPGGEIIYGLNPDIISDSELELHEHISDEQKKKQLGWDTYPAYTFRSAELMKDKAEEVWGVPYPNVGKGTCMANPTEVFKAMAYEKPYPVKAFIVTGNNPLMSYANQTLIYKALMNLELLVVHDLFLTPTAQLADYVLPDANFLERPNINGMTEWLSLAIVSQRIKEPPKECHTIFELWRDLGLRMGFESYFPWKTPEEFLTYRLSPLKTDWETFQNKYVTHIPEIPLKSYEKTGFATPTGKVELYSTILEKLGFDPLPYWRNNPQTTDEYPLRMFIGIQEPEFFQTAARQVESLRKRNPEPFIFLSPSTARHYDLENGDLVSLHTIAGSIEMKLKIEENMPDDLVRVPRGWWFPEDKTSLLSGAFKSSDAVILPDTDDYMDREQGLPSMRGIPCRVELEKRSQRTT